MRVLLACLVLFLFAQGAAAGELLLYVFQDGSPLSGAQARLDDEQSQTIPASGRVRFDLNQGNHRIEILQNGAQLHQLRFTSGANQNADVIVRIPAAGGEPVNAQVETYDPRESVAEREGAPTGQLTGEVQSQETGAAITGARVSVEGTDQAAMTDAEGRFSLTLPRGVYDLQISHPEYGNRTVEDVRIITSINQQVGYSLSLSGDGGPIEEVVATASYVPDTAAEQTRTAESVLDVIGSEQLARFGDSNAADAVRRSVGVNVAEGKYVFIRGLGGRYTSSTLNGANLPSTDPSRQTTPLDLFPAGVLDQVNVRKTFTPDMPGDSSGGNVNMMTRAMPEEDFFKVSGSIGANTRLTGDEEIVDPADGDFDFAGFDDGERELPALVDGLTAFGRVPTENIGQISPALLELMGQSFNNNLSPEEDTIPPNFDLGLSGGKRITQGDNVFGVLAAVKYKNGWKVQDEGEENSFQASADSLNQFDDFDFFETTNEVEVSGLVAATAELGLNHTLTSTSIASRITENSAKVKEGLSGENEFNTRQFQFEFEERQFLSQQFAGKHLFPAANDIELDWQYTHSRAERDSPDRREVLFNDEFSINPDVLTFNKSGFERRFDELDDTSNDLSADLKLPLINTGEISADFKTGFQFARRDRDSETARFTLRFNGSTQEEIDLVNQFTDADQLVSAPNIDPDLFELRNITSPSDRYQGELDTNAGYFMTDADLFGLFRVVAGARIEKAEQTVETTTTEDEPTEAGFDETDVLPSLNLTWFMNPDMQVRFAASKTISRPDFKEQANATFFDPVFDFTVRGNPDLQTSDVTNLDLRWEWYLSSVDSVTIGVFYKDLEQPIERVVIPSGGSGGGIRSFQNAEGGEISGIEFDARKEFVLDEAMSQTLFAQFNFAWIDSSVDLPEGTAEQGSGRDLQGQPENTLNLALGYDHLDSGQKVTLLFNRNGDSIEDAGRGALPNVIQEPVNQLDLNYEKAFTQDLKVKLEVQNLLDEETEFTQGGETFFAFKPGVSVELGADWTF